jgi:hypothetical protein
MIQKLIICRGIAGAGKSSLARKLRDTIIWSDIYSTDQYWIRPDGVYDWNPKRIGEAHQWNFDCFRFAFSEDNDNPPVVVFIDNTNIQYKDFHRYIEYAVKQNPKIEIILLEPNTPWKFDVDVLVEKNTHSVPKEAIQRMLDRWQSSESIASQIKTEFGVDVAIQIGEQI